MVRLCCKGALIQKTACRKSGAVSQQPQVMHAAPPMLAGWPFTLQSKVWEGAAVPQASLVHAQWLSTGRVHWQKQSRPSPPSLMQRRPACAGDWCLLESSEIDRLSWPASKQAVGIQTAGAGCISNGPSAGRLCTVFGDSTGFVGPLCATSMH